MPDLLDPPLEELESDLARLKGLLDLLELARKFGATEIPTSIGKGAWSEAEALRSSLRASTPALAVLSGSLLLYLAGRFEHFAVELLRAACDSLAGRCETFSQLPEKMREQLVVHTGRIASSPAKYRFDAVDVHKFIDRLASNLKAERGLGPVNSECVSVTDANLTPKELAELFKRIGISDLWTDLAKQARLKTHFAVQADAEAEREARAVLESLMAKRNEIAHPGSSPSFPDSSTVLKYLEFVRELSATLTDVVRVRVVAFTP
jgi:hypothetical protein